MVTKIIRVFLLVLTFFFLVYLGIPGPDFPKPPPDSVQSEEEADTETSLRRAYFTNYTREEVITHYRDQFLRSPFLQIPFFSLRLNYPPEDAQTLIRDQTRSTFLEEIVHPLRESIYIDGFEPTNPKDDVWYKGVDYRQKIIIRHVPSNTLIRLFVGIATMVVIVLLHQTIMPRASARWM